jgi:thioredoxin reductase (NADPH)
VQLAASDLLCFFGLKPDNNSLTIWGVAQDAAGKVPVDPATQHTNVPNLLAIGDICTYAGKLGLILTGFAEAAIAAKTAQSIIDPNKPFKLIYSTSKGLPK